MLHKTQRIWYPVRGRKSSDLIFKGRVETHWENTIEEKFKQGTECTKAMCIQDTVLGGDLHRVYWSSEVLSVEKPCFSCPL